MRTEYDLKLAALKAVNTYRYRQLEKCNLPQLYQVINEIKSAEHEFDEAMDKENFIAKNIGATSYKSFCRFGDRNRATPGLILFYIKNNGISLDEQAMFMSEDFGHEILPEDLAEFMMIHDCGPKTVPLIEKIERLKDMFKEIAGFNYNFRWINQYLLEPEYIPELPF